MASTSDDPDVSYICLTTLEEQAVDPFETVISYIETMDREFPMWKFVYRIEQVREYLLEAETVIAHLPQGQLPSIKLCDFMRLYNFIRIRQAYMHKAHEDFGRRTGLSNNIISENGHYYYMSSILRLLDHAMVKLKEEIDAMRQAENKSLNVIPETVSDSIEDPCGAIRDPSAVAVAPTAPTIAEVVKPGITIDTIMAYQTSLDQTSADQIIPKTNATVFDSALDSDLNTDTNHSRMPDEFAAASEFDTAIDDLTKEMDNLLSTYFFKAPRPYRQNVVKGKASPLFQEGVYPTNQDVEDFKKSLDF